ncbi:MAG: hypothetical protein WA865_18865 [Spirulinaceae cyanobacterium]
MSNSSSNLQEESEKQVITPLEEDLPTPETTPVSQAEEELPAKTLQDGIQLPEPDPDNITVLTGKLPNKPILPWNRYDSPWEEEEEREREREREREKEREAQLKLAAEKETELETEEVESEQKQVETVAELDVEEIKLEEVVIQEKVTTPYVVVESEAEDLDIDEEEDYVDLDEEIEFDEVE